MEQRPESGHRSVPHTADARIEAWAPKREWCVAEAVAAMVDGFADVSGAPPGGTVEFRVGPAADPDLLVSVLDRVILLMDTEGQLPSAADVRAADGGLDVRLRMAGPDRVETFGAVPKAVSLHELRFDGGAQGWSCAVTLDV
jgi:SHS2 domain-containing protein